ncbi:MAG: 4'-phosphopantetheinyl transferase family protein [Roseburia sp.]
MLQIYGMDIRIILNIEEWKPFLSEMRFAQLQRLKQSADRRRCVGAGLLEWYGMKCFCREQVPPVTAVGEKGKPYFPEFPGLQYNLSHSGDFVVAAFSEEPVGIDIAERRVCKDSLIRRCLTEAETRWLNGQEDRDEAFCRLWAGKESFVKWTGDGLRKDLRQVEITLDGAFFAQDLMPMEMPIGHGAATDGAYLKEWREPRGYSVCVCCGNVKQLENLREIHWITSQELNDLKKHDGMYRKERSR